MKMQLLTRILILSLLTVGLASGLSACGKKNAPLHPTGSDYPKKYPNK
tara:strand:- start:10639 stop:10782 length:144 start_codon:yes stop_codon:yes gene_type:complete